ncbi:MAG: GNAT family N-acetyltransferase [Chloroflexota bacterium]|nr:GNAT family N-acetyltransferase [Chloroflexota bacterium]
MDYWQGQRVRLRGVEPSDADTFYKWNRDGERARQLDFVWPPLSRAAVQRWAEEQAQKKLEDDAFHWIIEEVSGTPVGSIITQHCHPRTGTFSYAIDIAPEHRRQQYAQEAIQLVLRYYFEELRYQKVTVSIHSYNDASIALHETLGFVREGTLRRMTYTRGRYWDVHWYGMTQEEWHRLSHSS